MNPFYIYALGTATCISRVTAATVSVLLAVIELLDGAVADAMSTFLEVVKLPEDLSVVYDCIRFA